MPDLLPRYTWDLAARQYRVRATGKFVSRQTIRRALDRALERETLAARALANEYLDKTITLAEWQVGVKKIIKDTHLYSIALARGGWDRLTPSDYGRVGQQVRFHYDHLDAFRADLEVGIPLDGRYLRRTESYAQGSRALFHQIERLEMTDAGAVEERNVLAPIAAERHCGQCPNLTGTALGGTGLSLGGSAATDGWVPMGTLPLPGRRTCLSNCFCELEFRDAEGVVLERAA